MKAVVFQQPGDDVLDVVGVHLVDALKAHGSLAADKRVAARADLYARASSSVRSSLIWDAAA
jgi:hypothetical protein